MKKPVVYFADIAYEAPEEEKTLPFKFKRLLDKFNLKERAKGKNVAVQMHLGGGTAYTTIHPVFVGILVDKLREAGARSVKVMDNDAESGIVRGYTREVLGCPVVSSFGRTGRYFHREKIGYKSVDEALFSGEALDSDFFVDLSHLKAHGACGFGGAIKNVGMGMVRPETRTKLHGLEGGITYDRKKCTLCLKCIKSCTHDAMSFNKEKKQIDIFFHNCTYCQHCLLTCPEKAFTMQDRKFEDFSEGMAAVASVFLKKFRPENLLFINFLTNITFYCDCWGFSTPSLVPDLGIIASDDIAAADCASLDLVKTEDLIPKGLPKNFKLTEKGRHLFEKIHGKDPYYLVKMVEKYYDCSTDYVLKEIK